jgi:hypothetical protein
LGERNQQEEKIEEKLKFIVEHQWDERAYRILLVIQLVSKESLWLCRTVEIYHSVLFTVEKIKLKLPLWT